MDSRTGELITAPQAENGVFIWEINNPLYFTITRHNQQPFNSKYNFLTFQIRFNHNLRKALGIHKCFLNFRIWTTLQSPTGHFLRVFRYQVYKYLNNIGVISLNNVIRAVDYVLFDVFENTIDVIEQHEIKYNLY
uniref:Replication enhancer n=1 Tax=Tomato yellow leaf curl virus TaxID=10832 RepID=A6MNX2_9GEMI|nr:REn [Tomato yellow leaf curl virus]ABR27602.1 REn [Tomato yellow leaf curl virus]ABR27605.1 REn [Tomato yellow leaf curl virus]ABR27608.1 REn [Tomato yellow leaf curl virus]ABR27611.1 REn [Tomato yellow leaf curl virus]